MSRLAASLCKSVSVVLVCLLLWLLRCSAGSQHAHLHVPRPLQVEHDGFGNGGREGVAVIMPRGVYKITKMVEIYQSNVVLRGEGVSGWATESWRWLWCPTQQD